MTDFDAIVADAQTRQSQLAAIDSDIDAKIHAITIAAPPGAGLSPDDIAAIQALRKNQGAVLGTIQELALVTAGALDDSDAVARLAATLTSAVQILKTQIQAIAAVSQRAAEIGAISDGIEGIVGELTALIGKK